MYLTIGSSSGKTVYGRRGLRAGILEVWISTLPVISSVTFGNGLIPLYFLFSHLWEWDNIDNSSLYLGIIEDNGECVQVSRVVSVVPGTLRRDRKLCVFCCWHIFISLNAFTYIDGKNKTPTFKFCIFKRNSSSFRLSVHGKSEMDS